MTDAQYADRQRVPKDKLRAAEQIARWRRHLFDLDRLSFLGPSMTPENILKFADG